MFSPLVASHFICDFLAFEQGLFCPMWMLTVSLQVYTPGDIFHVKEKMNSLFYFVNYILACLVFLSVKILGDAKLERAYSSAACVLMLERNGTPNVFLSRTFVPMWKLHRVWASHSSYSDTRLALVGATSMILKWSSILTLTTHTAPTRVL